MQLIFWGFFAMSPSQKDIYSFQSFFASYIIIATLTIIAYCLFS